MFEITGGRVGNLDRQRRRRFARTEAPCRRHCRIGARTILRHGCTRATGQRAHIRPEPETQAASAPPPPPLRGAKESTVRGKGRCGRHGTCATRPSRRAAFPKRGAHRDRLGRPAGARLSAKFLAPSGYRLWPLARIRDGGTAHPDAQDQADAAIRAATPTATRAASAATELRSTIAGPSGPPTGTTTQLSPAAPVSTLCVSAATTAPSRQ